MSDKSFGDYTNRNVVKNPLLSTAVTGLSIEDLTQNAVLLPAVPSQELITRQDEQHGAQNTTLLHSEHGISNLPSSDTNSNQSQQNTQTNIANPLNNNKNTQNFEINEMNIVSKASVKSTDDFDVNEYFARLQGTRYVSAPLNSNVTDQNANLQAEENLEEINLNDSIEPDKVLGTENVQNSLTADIAQNFSQLPNVLPHVASAVFSSFSNMLSLKSREVTPEESKAVHDVQHRTGVMNVPFGVPEAPVSVAPPPLREPPMSGTTSNYRITTKKKVYAQVPGLSSGDHQHTQTFNPAPMSQNTPAYFIPEANVSSPPSDHSKIENVAIGFETKSPIIDRMNLRNLQESTKISAEESKEQINIFDPSAFVQSPKSAGQTGFDTNITDQANTYVSTQITPEESKEKYNIFDPAASTPKLTSQIEFHSNITDQASTENFRGFTQITTKETQDRFNLFNPAASVEIQTGKAVGNHPESYGQYKPNLESSVFITTGQVTESHPDAFIQTKPDIIEIKPDISSQTSIPNPATEFMPLIPHGSTTVIPPPPMFSNLPRRDSQATVGKSVLPPSVARRISANQPIMKPQTIPTMVPQENFFIPTIPLDPETHAQQNFSTSEYNSPNIKSIGHGLTADTLESNRQSQINFQAQKFPANNPQSSFQIPSHSSNQPLNTSNNTVPMISSSDTMLPESPTAAPLIPKGSSLPVSTPVPRIAQGASSTDTQLSSQPPKTIQPIRPPSFVSDTVMKSEDDATERSLQSTGITQLVKTEQANIAPPMFFNPATLNQVSIPTDEIQKNQDISNQQFPQFTMNSPPEPPKQITEPPKMTGNLNYRLTNKKPQYYSGPIEGVGNMSNNLKPLINPVGPSLFQGAVFTPEQNVQPINQNLASDFSLPSAQEFTRPTDLPQPPTGLSLFQGAIFTPDQNVQPITQKLATDYSSPSSYETAAPFDLNEPVVSSYPPFGAKEPDDQKPLVYQDFNTAFDLSRPTTERFEETRQESKGFGIIGSLKSKLSSIDINKIQSTVTTFFDPAYNETKVDEKKHEYLSQYDNLSVGNYENFPQTESASLEVFIPSAPEQIKPNPYNNQSDYSQTTVQPQYYQTQDYMNQAHNYPNPGWGNMYHQQPIVQQSSAASSLFPTPANITQDCHKYEIKPSTESEKLYTNTTIFTQDHTMKTPTEKHLKDSENDRIADISKITDSLLPDAIVHQELTETQELTLSDTRMEGNTERIDILSDQSKTSEISQSTGDSSLKSFFDYSKQEQQSLFDNIVSKENDFRKANIVYGHATVADSFASAFDLKQTLTQSISHTKTDELAPLPRELPRVTSRVFSNISAKDFFERQKSQENVIPAKPEKTDIGFELLQKTSDVSSKSYFDYHFTTPVLNVIENKDISSSKDVQSFFGKQSTTDVDTSKELLTTVILPVLKDLSDDLVPPQYLDDVNDDQRTASSSYDFQIASDNKPGYRLFDFGSSEKIPLIPGCASYKDIKNVEEKTEKVALSKSTDNVLKEKSSVSDLFEKSEQIEQKEDLLEQQVSELNICETCREVNKPEEKDVDDLTTQLIENITAPIQLAHPVEYPFVGSSLVTDKSVISHITEDIIKTMKLPPLVELIDDISVSTNINYGWSTNDTNSSKVLQNHDYDFQPDPLSLGFFQDKSLVFENIPTNASDEIKAEFRFTQEDTSILSPPITVPTAPPEEDTKSDESGLDVHSIEQDAKNDFPIFEEFVIEPSETDDDKIEYKERERSSDDPVPDADTFTNRIERYKKMETNPEPDVFSELRRDSLPFELPTSTSPAITIASYFDTGNYAVENHYKNSLTSPAASISYNVNTSTMRIPPGFEDEYKKRLSDIAASRILPGLNENVTFIPDTTTQTPATITLTVNNPNITFIPDTSTQRGLATLTYSKSPVENLNISDTEVLTMIEKIVEDSSSVTERLPAFSSIVEPKKETAEENKLDTASTEKEPQKSEELKLESLPDPINFFSSNAESTEDSDVYSNFSRLSSYFTSPPKPDHTKSFFELSQSQDHYRHKPKSDTFDSIQNNVISFFETTTVDTQTNPTVHSNNKTTNIPQTNIANMNLIHDLTSYKNFTPKEDVVRTVNYFTVVENVKDINIGEPKESKHLNEKERVENVDSKYIDEHKNNQLGDKNNLNFEDIIKECKYCCDTTKKFTKLDAKGVDFDNCKVRKGMDRDTDKKKEGDSNMAEKKESVNKTSLSVNFLDQTFQDDSSDKIVSMNEHRTSSDYAPVKYHWFYRKELEDKSIWRGFSTGDSKALEDAYNSPDLNEDTIVATDGGRYDVNVIARTRNAVYWTEKPTNVMRCSWFYKGTAVPRYVPYTESTAEKLEEMYHHSVTTGEWHRRLMLPNDEMVVMHGPAVMVHFLQSSTDTFSATPSLRQRVVRGCVESEIEDTEPSSIDHLLLMCHGVGSACDMRFRSVEEVVDDFRSTSLQLVQSHYKNSYDRGLVGRVEVLPISWHSSLHSGETGVDKRLAAVTLDSIPRLRNFTNDTLLDVLFYTSPVFCQTIIETVCNELNRIYALFKRRNPDYEGGISLGGHSLGSVILYDLLCHQMPKGTERPVSTDKQYVTGTAGTGQPCVNYPRLDFCPDTLYALGSPIAIFECIRGVQTLGLDFCLPTCKNFFNIFHPYDPIAYRLEPMVNPLLRDVKPYQIPHHKGRKRMHLELKDTMARVGADIKQKLMESIRSTWSSMWKTQPPPDTQLEKVVEEEIEKEALNSESKEDQVQENEVTPEMLGNLNDGRRIDHVLQEAPFEMINEYIFAMSSHVCYWESEDTMLVMLREIYNAIGVTPDCSVPQHTMTVQRSRLTEDSFSLDSPDSPSTSRSGS
ncbi:mucin-3A isoform X2 [Maniola hyperantus]|uniref:mucin-3A isoform X2 n=1 Tax=Aphantopus hyperantus TaxID=2795564 RepID=UPI00213F6A0C